MHYLTIVISDVHLGTVDSKTRELSKFLKNNTCDRLILNGDIIDGWNLRRRGIWEKKDTRVLRRILRMIEQHNTEVIYVRGNHDDFLEKIAPLEIGNFRILENYELVSGGLRLFVTHGDIFDLVTSRFKWIARLGDWGYKLLLWINRQYHQYRRARGLPYHSLSQQVKNRVKLAVNFITGFEEVMTQFAHKRGYDGVICGHIHHPAMRTIGG
ncbi:MAG: UDP-2,3-diacylglucosamine diphosphatase, partial [Bacteroidales bacterium]|nr:UDP-2,3-diacylglucosamine diphosphatase [Bacteroidales bacterium]